MIPRACRVVSRAAAAAAGLLMVALAGTPAHAAPFDWGGRDWEGCAELVDLARSELGASRVIVTSRLDLHALKPSDGVVIIHPQKSLDVEGYARFLRAGGRLVLLDDYGTGDALLTHFGMERVPMPEHPAESLRGNPSFAIAEPAGNHPVVNDVARVVTNHATGIRHPDLTPVLEVRSSGADHPAPGGESNGRPVLLAVAGAVSNGRLLAVGDASIVMNSMLRYAGNKMFARNLLHYAADDEAAGHGKGRVFLVEGSFDQIGTFGEDDAGGAWAERLRSLRDALASVRAEGFPPNMAYFFAVLVGLGIVMWTGSRAGRTHKAVTPRFTRPIPLAQQGGVAGHAALIGASRTPRILAMLELKSALEEELCAALGMNDDSDRRPGHEELTSALASRGWVAPEVIAHLRSLLLRMARVETMMLSQRSGARMAPVRDREVLATSREVDRILLAVREARGHAPSGSAT